MVDVKESERERERERERRSFLTCDVAKSFRIGPKERERERYDQQAFAPGRISVVYTAHWSLCSFDDQIISFKMFRFSLLLQQEVIKSYSFAGPSTVYGSRGRIVPGY